MAVDLFTLFGRIVVNKGEAVGDMRAVDAEAKKVAASIDRAFQKAGRSLERMGSFLTKSVTLPLLGLATGAAVLATKTADYAEELRNLSAATGLSRQQLQELKFITDQNGISFEAVTRASVFLQRSLMGVELGTGNAAKVLKALGIEVHNADGSLKSMSDVFPLAISRLQGMENATTRNMFASQIFGRALAEVAPLLGMTADDMEKARRAAHSMGVVMSEDALRAADKLDEQMDHLHARFQGLTVHLATQAIPVLERLVPVGEKIIGWAQRAADWFGKLSEKQQNALLTAGGLAIALGPVLTVLGRLLGPLGGVLKYLIALPGAIRAAGSAAAWFAGTGGPMLLVVASGLAAAGAIAGVLFQLRELSAINAKAPGAVLSDRAEAWKKWQDARNALAQRHDWITDSYKKEAAQVRDLKKAYDDLTGHYQRQNAKDAAALAAKTRPPPPTIGGLGAGDKAKAPPTRLELSQGYQSRLQAEVALGKATWADYFAWLQAAYAKYSGSTNADELKFAASLETELDEWAKRGAASAEEMYQQRTGSASKTVQSIVDAFAKGGQETTEDERQATEAKRQLDADWFQWRLDSGQEDLAAYMSRCEAEVTKYKDGTQKKLDAEKRLADAKGRWFAQSLALLDEEIATTGAGYDRKLVLLQGQLKLERDVTAQVGIRGQIQATAEEAIGREFAALQRTGASTDEQRAALAAMLTAWEKIAGMTLPAIRAQLDSMTPVIQRIGMSITTIMQGAAQGMESAFGQFFEGMFDGAARVGELWNSILSSIERQIAQILAAMAVKLLFQVLGLPIPGFASGGIVTRPTLAMVGEAGPEMIVPLSASSFAPRAGIFPLPTGGQGAGQGGPTFTGDIIVQPTLTVDSLDAYSLQRLGRRLAPIIGAEIFRVSRTLPVGA